MSRRVYLPLAWSDLAELAQGREVTAVTAYAVTSSQHRDAAADEEELEFDALCDALDAAEARRASPDERRLVAAADLEATECADGAPTAVRVNAPLRRDQVVCLHVEEQPGQLVGQGYDDLLWYDISEIETLAREAP